jgi:hypothetical protein
MRNKLILWVILLIAGFLAGFIPQHSRARQLQEGVSSSAARLEACRSAEQLSGLRNAAALMYLQATLKNYGTAGNYAGGFFDQAQRLANSTQDPALRTLLREVLTVRDQITADLAKGDGAVVSEMQPVLEKLENQPQPPK